VTELTSPEAHSQKIRAAVLREKGGPLEIESLKMEGPRDDEVLVRIVATGICRTDIDIIDEWDNAEMPAVLGHEGAGVVVRAGKTVKAVAPGDHVILSYQSCGRCPRCRRGHPWECRHLYEVNFGFNRLDGSNALPESFQIPVE
jgi:aryl-alcohol dehydrogenase